MNPYPHGADILVGRQKRNNKQQRSKLCSMLKAGKSSAKELSSKRERWQFYRVVWEGVTETVISEQRSKVVRECALWSSKEKHAGRGSTWKRPEAGPCLDCSGTSGRPLWLESGEPGEAY